MVDRQPITTWIAWAPHCSRAFRADTEAAAKRAAREWAASFGDKPTWRAMTREAWRCTQIVEGEGDA